MAGPWLLLCILRDRCGQCLQGLQIGGQSGHGCQCGRRLFEVVEAEYAEPGINCRLFGAGRAPAVHDEHAGCAGGLLCCLLNLFGDRRIDRAAHWPADADWVHSEVPQQVQEFRSIGDHRDLLFFQLCFEVGCEVGCAGLVFALTLVICAASGWLATGKLRRLDPAEVF